MLEFHLQPMSDKVIVDEVFPKPYMVFEEGKRCLHNFDNWAFQVPPAY